MSAKVFTGTKARTLLDAVAGTGAGAGCELEFAYRNFTMQTLVTGAPASVSVTLQGSLDGANWTTLATSTSTTGDQQYVVDKPQLFLRANLGTLTGGTAPKVTVYVVAAA